MTFRTRFAPSPTGPLHLGHAYSALLAHDMARAAGGDFLLRLEDIDQSRARPEWEDLIFEDLSWLGVSWDGPVLRQSERLDLYTDALTRLWNKGLLFACTCNRRDIQEASAAPQEGVPTHGPDGLIYPGTCRDLPRTENTSLLPETAALRLNMARALEESGLLKTATNAADPYVFAMFEETGQGPNDETRLIHTSETHLVTGIGDVVLGRRDMGTSYHLSVVIDDADQGITHVVRGQDLFEATNIHALLQRLLGLPTPIYHHHKLIRDDTGKRLAKRDDARAIKTYRDAGHTPEDVRKMVGL